MLLVEDVADDADLIVRALETTGRPIDWRRVETRGEMVTALDKDDWDIVLAELELPFFSGLEAIALLQAMRCEAPIVIVSGGLSEDAAVAIIRSGARDFVNKDHLARLVPVVERELTESALRREVTHLDHALHLRAAALAASSTAIYLADADGRIEWANQALSILSGYAPGELPGRGWNSFQNDLLDAETSVAIAVALDADLPWRGEIPQRRQDGSVATIRETVTPFVGEDGRRHLLVSQEDITAWKEAQERISFVALHDELTGLPNRRLFQDRLDYALSVARRTGEHIAIVFVDLDRFKETNDAYGHRTGDEVLRVLAERMSGSVRETDAVARFGGDEIVFAFADLGSPEDAGRLAQKMLEILAAPLVIEGNEIEMTASAGIAVSPLDGACGGDLIHSADVALNRAKQNGGGTYRFFAPEMNLEEERRTELEQGLRKALGTSDIWLEYQPQIDARSGEPTGVEALVRWRAASPTEFVPVAEASGLIARLDEWVLGEACRQAAAWKESGAWVPRISVNVSAVNLRDEGLVGRVERLLQELDLPGERLELEFTERMAVRDLEVAATVMTHLRRLGVRLAIDDFGTGWSSLAYLSKLPLHRLKIDQTFVQRIGVGANDEAIVRATIAVAHSLGLDVVAEGVETQEQLVFLKSAGCDSLQGYLFSRALPAQELEQLQTRHGGMSLALATSRSRSPKRRRRDLRSVAQDVAGPSRHGVPAGSVALVSSYPPTRCGIATFAASLAAELEDPSRSGSIGVVSCVDEPTRGVTPPEVVAEWVRGSSSSLEETARVLDGFGSVIVQHEFGLFGGNDGIDILELVSRLTAPVIVTLHTVSSTPTPSQRAIVEELSGSARVVVQTDIARERLLGAYDVAPGNIVVIPHGARLNIEPQALPDGRRRQVVLTWGLLGPSKGIEFALEAFANLGDLDPPPQYVVLGQTHPKILLAEGDSYRDFLESRAKGLGLNDLVHFENGYRDTASILAEVRAADIVLLPYRSHEQVVSGVLVEAIAAGKPVVATAFPHAVELLGEGSGIVVPQDDSGAIAEALRGFLTDPEIASAAAAVARRQARSLSWKSVGRRYRRLASAVERVLTPVAS